MALVNGTNYDHIDLHAASGGDVTRHKLQDSEARAMIGPTEASSTASAAHPAGSYFIYNNKLYQATSDIASGGTITPNTNCKEAPLGASVSDLKSAVDEIESLTIEEVEAETDLLNMLTWTSGRMAVTGVPSEEPGMRYSNSFSVSTGDKLSVSPGTTAFPNICAYYNGVVVPEKGAINTNEWTVPEGVDSVIVTVYVPASTYAPTAVNHVTKQKKNINDDAITALQSSVSDLDDELDDISNQLHEVSDTQEFSFTGFIGSNGNLISNDEYKSTDYVKFNNGYVYVPYYYKIKAFRNICIGFYDSDKNIKSVQQTTSSSTLVVVDGIIPYVENAAYFRISTDAAYLDDSKCYQAASNGIRVETIDDVVDDINEMKQNVSFVSGGFINYEGRIVTNADYKYTDYIKCKNNCVYIPYYYNVKTFNNLYIGLYDSEKNFVAAIPTSQSGTLEVKSGYVPYYNGKVEYFRISSDVSYNDTTCYLAPLNHITVGEINGEIIAGKSISTDKCSFIEHDEESNYLKNSDIIDNCYIDSAGHEHSATGLYATPYVELSAGTPYYYYGLYTLGYYAFYDEDKNVLEAHDNGTGDALQNPFTPPNNAKYGRFTIAVEAYKTTAWIYTVNVAPKSYELILNLNGVAVNPCDYDGLDITSFTKCLCIGDSLTAGTFNNENGTPEYIDIPKYSYPSNLARITGIEVTNKGHGGSTSAEWYELEENTDLSGYDFAIIQLGVNDQIRYGEFGNTSKTAFSNIISKLETENKNIKIFVANIIPAQSYSNAGYIAFSNALLTWLRTTYATDSCVFPLDMQQYGHTKQVDAYNCGHLSAYGYNRLARDYIAYIGWYMANYPNRFNEIQFIGTDYWWDNPNA